MNISLSIFFDILLTTGVLYIYAKSSTFLNPSTRLEAATLDALLRFVYKVRPLYFPMAVGLSGATAAAFLSADMLFAGTAVLLLSLLYNFRLYLRYRTFCESLGLAGYDFVK